MSNKQNQTRQAWNEAFTYHQQTNDYDKIKSNIINDLILDDKEKILFNQLDLRYKKVCQLFCNNGRELIALSKKYNISGLGVDISDSEIMEANKLKEDFLCKNIDFLREDVYELVNYTEYKNTFDYIYVTAGSLNWIEDLEAFFNIVNLLLKENGVFIAYEIHPVTGMFEYDMTATKGVDKTPKVINNYFEKILPENNNGLDYYGHNNYSSIDIIEYQHTLTEIFGALIKNNFIMEKFEEYTEDISAVYSNIANGNIPLSYMMLWRKNGCIKN